MRVDKLTVFYLQQIILGELVPQDPNDEPAEKLPEKIMKGLDIQNLTKRKPRKSNGKK